MQLELVAEVGVELELAEVVAQGRLDRRLDLDACSLVISETRPMRSRIAVVVRLAVLLDAGLLEARRLGGLAHLLRADRLVELEPHLGAAGEVHAHVQTEHGDPQQHQEVDGERALPPPPCGT